jgi:hypothetical protein
MKNFLTTAKEVGILSTNKNYKDTMRFYSEYLSLKDKYNNTLSAFLEIYSVPETVLDIPVNELIADLGLIWTALRHTYMPTALTDHADQVKLILDNAKGN